MRSALQQQQPAGSGTLRVRRDIAKLFAEQPQQRSLFLQALAAMQATHYDNPDSYFQLAGAGAAGTSLWDPGARPSAACAGTRAAEHQPKPTIALPFFRPAGIHGLPNMAYQGIVNPDAPYSPRSEEYRWGGYCPHGSVDFPTW